MRFWPFAGRKIGRSTKPERPLKALTQEKAPQPDHLVCAGPSAESPEKAAAPGSDPKPGFRARKLSKRAAPAPSYPIYTLPRERQPPSTSAAKYFAGSSIEAMYTHYPDSQSSIGPEKFEVVRAAPSLRRRGDQEAALPRHRSSKRKAEDHAREQEVRAMSSPIPVPKRTPTRATGPLRQETKLVPGDFNRNFERPRSQVSLPLPESFSEMNEAQNQNAFKVNTFAMLSPRPTVRYGGSTYLPPRIESPAPAHEAMTEEERSSSKRIAGLADNLDSGGLREIMERDRRRRERKKEIEKTKLHRKLQRRAERQRAEEEQRRAQGLDSRPRTPSGKGVRRRTRSGADMESGPTPTRSEVREGQLLSSGPMASEGAEDGSYAGQDDPFGDDKEMPDVLPGAASAPGRAPRDGHLSQDPFCHPGDGEAELSTAAAENLMKGAGPPPLPAGETEAPREQEAEELGLPPQSAPGSSQPTAHLEKGRLSPPSSPIEEPTELVKSTQAPREARQSAPGLGPANRRQAGQTTQTSSWTAFFKRGGKRRQSSTDRERTTPSEFSNTSRESFSRPQPPPGGPPRSFRRSDSGTPHRTQSKFREDLPELPLSPPDSRMQSPEAVAAPQATSTQLHGGGLATSSSIPTLERSRPEEHLTQHRSVDVPSPETAPGAPPLPQALASVDSEGSWLSGKPVKRSSIRQSQSSMQHSLVAPSDERDVDDVADDEYFHRLTPAPGEARRSSSMLGTRKASSTAMAGDEDESLPPEVPPLADREGETWHGSVGRQPTVVPQVSRAKSNEGLLNEFRADEPGSPGSSDGAVSPEFETPADELRDSPILRARSVEYKGHARRISAGSAKLLDIRRSSTAASEGGPSGEKIPTTPKATGSVPTEGPEKSPD